MPSCRRRIDSPVEMVIAMPMGRDILDLLAKDAKAMMDFPRKATYELSPTPLNLYHDGCEFEDKHRA